MADEAQSVRIRVTSGYRGANTGNIFIPEGEYDPSDPRLLGQSAFLVASGRAVELDDSGKPTQMTVQAGRADRDLAGKPIVVKVPEDQGLLSNSHVPIYAQFPNNADASQVIQPYEVGGTEPAAIMGAEAKLVGATSGKTEVAARQEAAATAAAIPEAEAVRAQAAAVAGQSGESAVGDNLDAMEDSDLFELAQANGMTFAEVPTRADLITGLRKQADENGAAELNYDALNVDELRAEVKRLQLTPVSDDGTSVAISKANQAQLLAALKKRT